MRALIHGHLKAVHLGAKDSSAANTLLRSRASRGHLNLYILIEVKTDGTLGI